MTVNRMHLLRADARHIPLADKVVQTCVTSPPYYGLRDYGVDNQIGLEDTLQGYIDNLVAVFDEVWRVLRDDGTLWLNLGDSYAGNATGTDSNSSTLQGGKETQRQSLTRPDKKDLPAKNLLGVPWRVALALQERGWYLRSDIIWSKTSCMPESMKDRPTKSHEYIFLLAKNKKYYYDYKAISVPQKTSSKERMKYGWNGNEERGWVKGKQNHLSEYIGKIDPAELKTRNRWTVWEISPKPYSGAHFATFPPELPELCIKAGSAEGDIVLDPFSGSGTTVAVANQLGRHGIGMDLSAEYNQLARERTGLSAMDAWMNGSEESEANLEDLPMFGWMNDER